jgi:starch synthase (maltosyl-transferring)
MWSQSKVPIIYNLFPRLVGTMPQWLSHADRAADMGFNWLFINSIHYPGYSGSLYAVKHHYRINPDFLPDGGSSDGMALLKQTLRSFVNVGLWPMMDLIINHTSRDCPLTREHPAWYAHGRNGELVSPFVRDLDDPTKVTVWDDLAEIDNAGSVDRLGLWGFWAELVEHYLRLGFKGFRCDAAYKVPVDLWRYLIKVAAEIDPEAQFFAETLGAPAEQTLALRDAGFHYLFNSSKWWDFEKPWCLEQHENFGAIAPSISFPESHDTPRLAAETGGSEAVQRQRYAFASLFSAGVMMPVGYEFGFKKSLDVVFTSPLDWEKPAFDLQHFIRRVNLLKLEQPFLQDEGHLRLVKVVDSLVVLERLNEQTPGKIGWILVNRSWDKPVSLAVADIDVRANHRLYRVCKDDSPWEGVPLPEQTLTLDPAEVALISQP